jgi:hypothetical protein
MGSKSSKINDYIVEESHRNYIIASPHPNPLRKSKSNQQNQLIYDYSSYSNLLRIRSRSLDLAKVRPFQERLNRSVSEDSAKVKSSVQCSAKLPWLLSKLKRQNDVSVLDFKFGNIIGDVSSTIYLV